jgi:hypothetical protein
MTLHPSVGYTAHNDLNRRTNDTTLFISTKCGGAVQIVFSAIHVNVHDGGALLEHTDVIEAEPLAGQPSSK